MLAFTAAVYVLGLFIPAVATYPASMHISTAPWWGEAVRWINVHFFDALDAVKSALLLNVLIPVKRFMVAQTWPLVAAALAFAGWQLGGMRLAALAAALALFIAFNGQWENAMETVYLCGISVIIAAAIGIPLGILGGLSDRAWRVLEAVIDTLQTLPSFVYLIPVVMLFRVGDFTAMIAIVLYALAPAVRYTAHGIRNVQPTLIEAGTAAGCTPRQTPDEDPPAAGDAGHSARHQPDGDARALHAGHHRAGRHARPRPGGLHRPDQGRHRTRAGRRALRRRHRHHRRPADPDRRSAVSPPNGEGARVSLDAAREDAAARVAALAIWSGRVDPLPLAGGITNQNFTVEDRGRRYVVRVGERYPGSWRGARERAGREPRGAFGGSQSRRGARRAGHSGPRFRRGTHLHAGGRAQSGKSRAPGRHGAAVSPRRSAISARAWRDVLGVPRRARLRAHAARSQQPARRSAAGSSRSAPRGSKPPSVRSRWCSATTICLRQTSSMTGKRLWLVDWEYAGFNSPLFDLGGLASNSELSPEQAEQALSLYFGRPVDDDLRRRAAAMTAASLLRETMWSMVSEIHSTVDFDYAAYTAENLRRFEAAYADFQTMDRA